MLKPAQAREGGKGAFASLKFLKGNHLPKKGEVTLVVDEMREAPPEMEFSDYLLDVRLGKKRYTMGLRVKSRNYRLLLKAFGNNEKKWQRKKFQVSRRPWVNPEGELVQTVRVVA